MKIAYSQCWEDTDALCDSLIVTPNDKVLSIASAGDNTFALLLNNPSTITAVDYNPAQLFLCELKIAAIQKLSYGDFLEFIGVTASTNRIKVYATLRSGLSKPAIDYWDQRPLLIDKGIIHIGKLDKYFKLFRTNLLPLIHSNETIKMLFEQVTLESQQSFYFQKWNSVRWRLMFKSFFNKYVLSMFGRNSSYFDYIAQNNIADTLYKRTENGFTQSLASHNWYLRFILTGKYLLSHDLPHYMRWEQFHALKNLVHKIKLTYATLDDCLASYPDNYFTKINLSDALEYYSPENRNQLISSLTKKCCPDALISLWTLFQPVNSLYGFEPLNDNENKTKTFFYNSFCTWKLVGKNHAQVRH